MQDFEPERGQPTPPPPPPGQPWPSGVPGSPPTFVTPPPAQALAAETFRLAGWGRRFAAWILDTLFRLVLAFGIAFLLFVVVADDPFSVDLDSWVVQTDQGTITDPTLDQLEGVDITGIEPGPGIEAGANNLIWMLLTASGLYLLSAFLYAPLTMALMSGSTPAKRLLDMRVVGDHGHPVGFGRAFVREPLVKGLLMNVIAGTFFIPWLLNYLWPLWDREARAGQDFICSTRVVRRSAVEPAAGGPGDAFGAAQGWTS